MPDTIARLVIAGGVGLIPTLAVALIYDPQLLPSGQEFRSGISRFLGSLLRLLVIPTLLVAVIYVVFIPFNFWAPFEHRDVLFAYNAMLFAVMGLLLGATPIHAEDVSLPQQSWLRRAILVIASLAVLVSLYALSAILYRTVDGGKSWTKIVSGISPDDYVHVVREDPKRAPRIEVRQADRSTSIPFLHQQRGNEKPAQNKKYVNAQKTSRNHRRRRMVKHHHEDGDDPDAHENCRVCCPVGRGLCSLYRFSHASFQSVRRFFLHPVDIRQDFGDRAIKVLRDRLIHIDRFIQ